jgi:hypothetical protein
MGEDSLAGQVARAVLAAVAFLLPHLDEATRSEWLLYGAPPAMAYAAAVGSVVLYLVVVTAAGLFDFARKEP